KLTILTPIVWVLRGRQNEKKLFASSLAAYRLSLIATTACFPRRVVDYNKMDQSDYATLSIEGGFVRMREGDTDIEYLPLDRFIYEYSIVGEIVKRRTFFDFKKWKAFMTWKKTVNWLKIDRAKKGLEENLFIINRSLRPAILNVREMCYRISDMGLCKIDKGRTYRLPDFKTAQQEQLDEVSKRLKEFRDLVKEVVRTACRTALLEAGFTPDDYFVDEALMEPPGTASSYMMQSYDMDIYAEESPDKMTYTEQANKRNHCQRLSCFIRLADYLIVNTMHVLAVNSVTTMLNYLQEQLANTPSLEEIQSYNRQEDEDDDDEAEEKAAAKAAAAAASAPTDPAQQPGPPEERPKSGTAAAPAEEPVAKVPPLFITEFVLDLSQIDFAPSNKDFVDEISVIVDAFKDVVLNVQNLVPDAYFDAFTRPIINNKFEEKTCGDGPSLHAMFEDDRHLSAITQQIRDSLDAAFNAANQYSNTFEPFRKFYQENEATDLESFKQAQIDVEFFHEALKRYNRQERMATGIVEERPIGMLLVNGANMKSLLIPSPQRCLEAIHDLLPRLARGEVDRLVKESQDAEYKLLQEPKDTTDYVDLLTFLDEIQQRIEPLENEAEVVKEMYELVDHFKVPVPPEDQAVFQTLFPSIDKAKNAIDKALAEREANVDKFVSCMERDIAEINKEVREVKQEAQNPMILDVTSEKDKVMKEVAKLLTRMEELRKRAYQYKAYQKNFKVEQTKFDELEEVLAELKLKEMLWNSIDEWDKYLDQWKAAPFMELDVEDLSNTTMKYMKAVQQLEKGLPPNPVVPRLKEKVDDMRTKLPVVTDLRNENLKDRHWNKIEEIVSLALRDQPEPFTLGTLIEIKAFEHSEALQEVSGQASSEASLEQILLRVEEAWKTQEFIILPYKEHLYKDVYMLGGTDDIQQLLDDSNINIATIASSRHVGPIKHRVDDWQANLELFGKTLEEWVTCQRNWMYLESVFSAPDIQKQLPSESKSFMSVDKSYKEIMRKAHKAPMAMRYATQAGLLETFKNNNLLLDEIQKCLEDYLESKRVVFPRFYFLSNDELLEILAQTRNPQAVQPHLRKCFDAISKLEFGILAPKTPQEGEPAADPNEVTYSNDIHAMLSPEGEKVSLGKGLKARGNVEDWLGKVEEAMFSNLRKLTKASLLDYMDSKREEWLTRHCSQVVLTVSQTMWCSDIEEILSGEPDTRLEGMKKFEQKCFQDLNKLAAVVRGDLPKLLRALLCALITIDVHARDMVTEMVENEIDDVASFDWQKQLRYYWDKDEDNCIVKMSNSRYYYGYEYLGASPRLVITPLTDRCYLCLMGALQLDLGGAPAGPAGTGKTETTKDLAKSLAKQCVVFNCSMMMGRFFSGLAQSGAWCCFDEFNRIDIEVLSVIAQQLITIRQAKAGNMFRFMSRDQTGKDLRRVHHHESGYAGRTELPDNLKALFRPISMMVPDYRLIAEVILYSEGFESSKNLALKMTQMYKLCSEQLSQQDHYDFGMRALKSVLVMAGALKRENPDKHEDVVLIRALRDSNLPKFLKQDAVLFKAILRDLFPGVQLPEHDYGLFREEICSVITSRGLQIDDTQVLKVIQFWETLLVRHGVMLVGPTGGGKTTVYKVLADVLDNLKKNSPTRPEYQPVKTYVLNPKSITMGELYGSYNLQTMEWHDGLMGVSVRTACADETEDHQWVICDGPVDALWIENMNTCKIWRSLRLPPVSRCGMVYVDPEDMGWRPYVRTWLTKLTTEHNFREDLVDYVFELFNKYIDPGLTFIHKKCTQAMAQVNIAKVMTVCNLFQSLLCGPGAPSLAGDENKPLVCTSFVFSYLWGVGGNTIDANWDSIDNFVRQQFEDNGDARLPSTGDLWSSYVDMDTKRMDLWEKIIPTFTYNKSIPFFEMVVPTVDTVRFGYLLEKSFALGRSVLFTGGTGVGKSVVARGHLNSIAEKANYVPIYINFSAQTSSNRTQEMIEDKLEKKRKNVLGAPTGKKIIIFVDDLNMPKLDTYGSQPPCELLRQYQDFGGFYERDKLYWISVQDMLLGAACAPPGGGRNPVTPRLIRHFNMFCLPPPSEYTLKHMFNSIMVRFLVDFPPSIRGQGEAIVGSAVELYFRMATDLLPTPAKSHYVFNLRDLSKCVQGILQADPGCVRDKGQLFRLFCHETQRVFHDRLINAEDKMFFHQIICEMASKYFGEQVDAESFITKPILFGDFMKMGAEKADRLYEELTDVNKVKQILGDYLDDYNMVSNKEMKLVFFMDAIEHVTRIARMIRQERGNALLVGVGGTGKQSLTRLAAHINSYKCFQIELSRGYGYKDFREDIKQLYTLAGVENQHTVFLFTDTQIVVEEFLEDINNILNSGEVPNLFEADEKERLIIGCRPAAKEVGIAEGNRDAIYDFCINRVRNNLHIVLCMSPVGNAFRSRCRMFPSLVNCCTIDWFTEWPREALMSVAQSFFSTADVGDDELKEKLSEMCVMIHTSVTDMADKFYNELKRKFYTTPTSYLELINLYLSMLAAKKNELTGGRDRVKNGLLKLLETNQLVGTMEVTLTEMRPKLEQKQKDVEALMEVLTADQEKADVVRSKVKEDEAVAKVKAMETEAIQQDAQKDLDEALPALEAAVKALNSLDKNDISEIRVFTSPPPLVQTVMEAVCLLLGSKTDWASAKQVLGDTNFLRRLMDYPKDEITNKMLAGLKKYMENPEFTPSNVEKVSKACKSMCMWVRAMDMYAKVYRTVEPKKKKLEAANAELNVVMSTLRQKQAQLQEVEDKIATLQKKFDDTVGEKKTLEHELALTAARLKRAGKLTTALADEKDRWEVTVENFNKEIGDVVGNVFIAAACVSYYGAFTSEYRAELVNMWVSRCLELKIPTSENVTLFNVLGNPYTLRQWNTDGLPRDQVSTENAILVTRGRRWPLMIDPQEQANRWIKNKESRNGLQMIKLSDPNFLRTLENAIRLGMPVLCEDVGESLDAALEPVLLKQTYTSGGRLLIRLGDKDVEYDKNFAFYMTSKLSNPHYLPEVCIKVTIINFTVTPRGLEDQLLSEVTRLERPDLEKQRNELILKINNERAKLKAIEDNILKMLYESEGNILDNEELIKTLNDSKITSAETTKKLAEAEITEQKISAARSKYIPVAERGSCMYFVVANMAEIDPMYQFSLKYFKNLFNNTIESSEKSDNLEQRIQIMLAATTNSTYNNVARGIFEKDKLVFSFLLCIEILKQSKIISPEEWNFFLRGAGGMEKKRPERPAEITWMNDPVWRNVIDLADFSPIFRSLTADLLRTPVRVTIGEVTGEGNPADFSGFGPTPTEPSDADIAKSRGDDPSVAERFSGHWDKRLTSFQKLMLIKVLQEQKVVPAITEFVKENLGKEFVEAPSIELNLLYSDMSKTTPLVFVLSTGSDPMNTFQRFAKEKNFDDRYHAISLGQGQGVVAEKLISAAVKSGDWVFLQNCHLAASWMLSLENIVKDMAEKPEDINQDFRLFLSSMPAKAFPVSVLQNSVKVTNEPPKGLRNNIKRAFAEMSPEEFETNILGTDWKKIVFGICFFHGIILERKKFGPLGWNIRYEFNDSDRQCALLNLKMFCAEGEIPWDALIYITGEITYGGRVTDNWDQRCLRTILTQFFHPKTLEPGYKYSPSGVYYPPDQPTLQDYKDYVDQLPLIEDPEIFGLHSNANLAYQIEETRSMVEVILEIQPRVASGGGGKSNDEIVYELADSILGKIMTKIDLDLAKPELFEEDSQGRLNSLTTVLTQEIDRYNRLLTVIRTSLEQLKKAIKGFVVMSEELDSVYTAFINNQVPKLWSNVAYPSLKTLSNWIKDLILRCWFVHYWLTQGMPKSFWLPGFFFPQGFLTGTLQNYARKYNYPIDHLSFEFIVKPVYRDQEEVNKAMQTVGFGEEIPQDQEIERPEDGVLVHGLFTDGFRFDCETMRAALSHHNVMLDVLPMLHMQPKMDFTPDPSHYISPLYKTKVRAGVLSTTGHSTNFVVSVPLPSDKPQDFWINMGAALLCEKTD
uniref:DHC_N2 domain-containing protein n=1 Tax=Macrostomum lignano TaxID=282301 RepID=A0A1I8GGQ9_9PLAT